VFVPAATRITSRQHAIVQRCRRIARRIEPDVVLLDGEHLVAEALDAAVRLELLLTDGRAGALAARAQASGAVVYECTGSVLEAASPVRTPSGVVALAKWRPVSVEDALQGAEALVLALCDVQDPGNVGSAIRSADALGATGVLVLDGTAHPGGWKALRGSMGSMFRLPIGIGTLGEAAREAKRRGLQIAASVAAHGTPADKADLRSPAILLLGNEGGGLSDAAVSHATARVTIPMRSRVNSLNVAATAALLLYESRRQRTQST
jgi:TrmH family RNA methyltransferase